MDKRKGLGYGSRALQGFRPNVPQSLFPGFFLLKRNSSLEGKQKKSKFLSPKKAAFLDARIRKTSKSISPDFLDKLKSIKKSKFGVIDSLEVCAKPQYPSPYIYKREWQKVFTRGKSVNIIRRPSQILSNPLGEKIIKKNQLAKIRVFHSVSSDFSQAKPLKISRKKSQESSSPRNDFLLELSRKISKINGSLLPLSKNKVKVLNKTPSAMPTQNII